MTSRHSISIAAKPEPLALDPRQTAVIVVDMLGHSQVGITLNLYSHVTPTMQRQAAEAMDTLLGAAR